MQKNLVNLALLGMVDTIERMQGWQPISLGKREP